MDTVMWITCFSTVALCVAGGIALINGKGAFLIAGYNTMSPEEQARYDEKALGRFVGWLLIAVSACTILLFAGVQSDLSWLTATGGASIFICSAGALIYMNTGKRFLRANNATDSKADESEMIPKGLTFAVLAFMLMVVVVIALIVLFKK
jgi:hypothetical protein